VGKFQSSANSNANPESYNLSQEDIDSVYKTIFQKFAANHPSLEFPRFVILGAQPGAGKSVFSRKLKREFEQAAKPVHIDIDALRELHPYAERILHEDPLNFGGHTHADSGIWTAYLLRDAKMSKKSILYEASLRSAEWSKSEIEAFKADGCK
jgi:hypothetical protein